MLEINSWHLTWVGPWWHIQNFLNTGGPSKYFALDFLVNTQKWVYNWITKPLVCYKWSCLLKVSVKKSRKILMVEKTIVHFYVTKVIRSTNAEGTSLVWVISLEILVYFWLASVFLCPVPILRVNPCLSHV